MTNKTVSEITKEALEAFDVEKINLKLDVGHFKKNFVEPAIKRQAEIISTAMQEAKKSTQH